MMAVSHTVTARNSERETISARVVSLMPVSSAVGTGQGRGDTVSVPRVSQSMFLRKARMISRDADGGDGQVVGPQAEADIADEIGDAAGDGAADEPGQFDRQADTADEAGLRLDERGGGVDLRRGRRCRR